MLDQPLTLSHMRNMPHDCKLCIATFHNARKRHKVCDITCEGVTSFELKGYHLLTTTKASQKLGAEQKMALRPTFVLWCLKSGQVQFSDIYCI